MGASYKKHEQHIGKNVQEKTKIEEQCNISIHSGNIQITENKYGDIIFGELHVRHESFEGAASHLLCNFSRLYNTQSW